MLSLEEAGIVEISLAYTVTNQEDKYGNLLRYASTAVTIDKRGNRQLIPTFDVFFVLLQ